MNIIPYVSKAPRPASRATAKPRRIIHVDLDCFFVAVERVLDPSLSQKPVIVGGDPDGRGVVTSASREARECGVHAGMASAIAKRLCPEAVFVRGRGRLYGRASSAAMRLLSEYSSEMERASIDEAYLDAGELAKGAEDALDLAASIQRALMDQLGLPASVGIGSNKLVAKLACQRAKPEGILEVWPGYEESFVAPLAVQDLPGIGPVLAEQLRLYGLNTAGELARVSPELLKATFGSSGARLLDLAKGVGSDTLAPGQPPRSLGHETTFSRDVRDSAKLIDTIGDLAESVSKRAHAHGMRGWTVTLKLRTDAFHTITRSRTLSAPTDSASELSSVATFLLREGWRGDTAIRLIGVSLSRLDDGPVQQSLFPDQAGAQPDPRPAALGATARDGDGDGFPWSALLPPSLASHGLRSKGEWNVTPSQATLPPRLVGSSQRRMD